MSKLGLNDLNTLIELRHVLHQYPELSGAEKNTADLIADFLAKFKPTRIIRGLGGSGLAAIFSFGGTGPSILFRCELDGLPIKEQNPDLPYRSGREGVGHLCGHDGHMSIVAGLAPIFAQKSYKRGKIILLFQPAEEVGTGAKEVLADMHRHDLSPTHVFALHNLPGYKEHVIVVRNGPFNAAVISVCIKLKGTVSHAAEPEKGKNPAMAISEILYRVNHLNNPHETSDDFSLITPIHLNLGSKAYGTSAGYGEMYYTVRSWTSSRLLKIVREIRGIVAATCHSHTLNYDFETLEGICQHQQ